MSDSINISSIWSEKSILLIKIIVFNLFIVTKVLNIMVLYHICKFFICYNVRKALGKHLLSELTPNFIFYLCSNLFIIIISELLSVKLITTNQGQEVQLKKNSVSWQELNLYSGLYKERHWQNVAEYYIEIVSLLSFLINSRVCLKPYKNQLVLFLPQIISLTWKFWCLILVIILRC